MAAITKDKKAWGSALLCLLLAVVLSCDRSDSDIEFKRLRIALLPHDTPDKLIEQFTPLAEHLSEAVGVPHEIVVSENYEHLLELFHERRVDLAVFGGITFLQAYRRDNAVPLVTRGYKTRWTTYFLVRADRNRNDFSQYKGSILGLGTRLSTSGHLMPRYFLGKLGIMPETFFSSVLYSSGHVETAGWVRDGKVDVAAVNSVLAEKMYEDGRLSREDVRILWKAPAFVDQVFALHPSIPQQAQNKIRDAFLDLTPLDPAHRLILDRVGADGFHPLTIDTLDPLIDVATAQGLLE